MTKRTIRVGIREELGRESKVKQGEVPTAIRYRGSHRKRTSP